MTSVLQFTAGPYERVLAQLVRLPTTRAPKENLFSSRNQNRPRDRKPWGHSYTRGQLFPAITPISSVLVYHIPDAAETIKNFKHLTSLSSKQNLPGGCNSRAGAAKRQGAARRAAGARPRTRPARVTPRPRAAALCPGLFPAGPAPGRPQRDSGGACAVPARCLRAAALLPRPGTIRTARAPPPPAHCAGAKAPIGRRPLRPGRASSSRSASFPAPQRRPRSRPLLPLPRPVPPRPPRGEAPPAAPPTADRPLAVPA